ncbi:MMPL family transporter [Streptomyces sp. NPDC054849]
MALDNGRDLTVVAVADRIPVDSPAAGKLLDDERRLGQSTLPQGQKILAAGGAAALTDLQRAMRSALTQVAILVLAGAFLLMLVVCRSLVLPVKAIAMNLMATGAACGLLSWFTGHTVNVLVPLMALTVVFGLSLDYEVFLVHRITEHHRAGAACQEAVVRGLSSTAQPITLAATTMSVVFAGLLVTGRQELRQVGFLVAVAVLLDATVIRLLVVPALMRLLGHRNWWLPSPLARLWPPLPAPPTAPQVPRPGKAADSYTTTAWSHSEEHPHEHHRADTAHLEDLDGSDGRCPHHGHSHRSDCRIRRGTHHRHRGEPTPHSPVLPGRDPTEPPPHLHARAHLEPAHHPHHSNPPPDRMHPPSGPHPQLRSATLALDGTARAGCSGASTPDGSARITWYNAQGHHAGTSTVQSTPRFVNSYNPGDALLSGRVTQGPLRGTRMTGTATPTSDVSGCAVQGLRTLYATGTLKFQ